MRGTRDSVDCRDCTSGIIPAYAGNTCLLRRRPRHQRDHPRVCGEHHRCIQDGGGSRGSSPRMRGTHGFSTSAKRNSGIIPAYAGNTVPCQAMRENARDHPRVCGEHEAQACAAYDKQGSSPRMRGTPTCADNHVHICGIIPAYAGNTGRCSRRRRCSWDHPRVCGEHSMYPSILRDEWGSSPRMRGTHVYKTVGGVLCGIIPAYAGNTPLIMIKWWTCLGSSPRMRGTPRRLMYLSLFAGIIPAYAGNTRSEHHRHPDHRDHPRVCGEHERQSSSISWNAGSSPRMRGTHAQRLIERVPSGIIPAYAGNTEFRIGVNVLVWDHPRVCGEHAVTILAARIEWGSSPRMRGTPGRARTAQLDDGIIPAYAGNTADDHKQDRFRRDHPRVCGEHLTAEHFTHGTLGSSPRMRGTPVISSTNTLTMRIIPAYAGNTCRHHQKHQHVWDHPRVCGEHLSHSKSQTAFSGSSPRMRGTPGVRPARKPAIRIIPAYAGNTQTDHQWSARNRDHPRVCGEHHCRSSKYFSAAGSSPRMRGTLIWVRPNPSPVGIIPAYAGNTDSGKGCYHRCTDHPRVCGEHPCSPYPTEHCRGIIPAYAGNTLAIG